MQAVSSLAASACSVILATAFPGAALATPISAPTSAPILGPQGELRPLNVMTEQTTPRYLADLDQDGRDDIIGGVPAFWMQSEPDSGFSAPRKLADGFFFVAAAPVDADGDGDLDLLAVSNSQLFLLKNDGRSNFEPQSLPIQLAPIASSFVFDDVDGDGVPDIIVSYGDLTEFYLGLGSGSYGFRVPNQFPGENTVLRDVADQDGDGQLDLLLSQVAPTGHRVFWARHVSGGNFGIGPTVATGVVNLSSAKAGDIDGDGRVDVALAQHGTLAWHKRDSMNGYGGPLSIASAIAASDVQLEDVTGDQSLDLLYTGYGSAPGYGIFVNDGAGAFAPGQSFPDPLNGQQRLLIGDVDADGDQDLIMGIAQGAPPRDLRLAEATSPGTFAAPRTIFEPIGDPGASRVHHGDVNGDGATDLIVVDTIGSQRAIKWLEAAGNGEFQATHTLDTTALSIGVFGPSAFVADFNGDGFADIMAAANAPSGSSNEVYVFDGAHTGPAQPRPIGTLPSGASVGRSRALDVDLDGDLDLVCLGTDLSWLENDGQGAFGSAVTIAANAFSIAPLLPSIAIADFDADGTEDILISGANLFSLIFEASLFRGLPGGSYGAPIDVTTSTPGGIEVIMSAADIDQDGDLDLVYSFNNGVMNFIDVRENLGSLQFGPQQQLLSARLRAGAPDVHPVDWDLDGDIDFVAAGAIDFSTGRGGIEWVESFGGQSFAAPALIALGQEKVQASTLIDIDGDLVLDIVGFEPGRLALTGYVNEQTVGNVYCASTANSTGRIASLAATGSAVTRLNALQLGATELPANIFGFFLGATAPDQVPGAGGTAGVLCLGGQIGRYSRPHEIRNSGPSGSFSLTLDLTDLRTPSGSTSGAVGQTWYFQAWFRDANPAPTSNLTSALAVTLQ